MSSPIRVAVTGAAGNIGYSLIFRLASGETFGQDQPIILHLLEVVGCEGKLHALKMELEDCAFPLLQQVIIGTDAKKVFEGIDYLIAVGAMPRGAGMERKDLLTNNAKIFFDQGKAIDIAGHPRVRVLVVGNPCNTNCLVMMHSARSIPKENFFAMTMLDENRARAQISLKIGVSIDRVQIAIWGNHSPTMVPDIDHATVSGKSLRRVITNNHWLETEFMELVQQRGSAIIRSRGASSAASAANAICDALKSVHLGSKHFSMGVYSGRNSYGISEDLVYSFPCRTHQGKVEIISGLKHSAFVTEKLRISEKELLEERDAVREYLRR